eukprot:13050801-Ditylum_brightwellii.AAC.1
MLNENASVSSSTADGAERNVIGVDDGANGIGGVRSDDGTNGDDETNGDDGTNMGGTLGDDGTHGDNTFGRETLNGPNYERNVRAQHDFTLEPLDPSLNLSLVMTSLCSVSLRTLEKEGQHTSDLNHIDAMLLRIIPPQSNAVSGKI